MNMIYKYEEELAQSANLSHRLSVIFFLYLFIFSRCNELSSSSLAQVLESGNQEPCTSLVSCLLLYKIFPDHYRTCSTMLRNLKLGDT